jgi:soluble lytic murein transglycosylase-like protein
VTRPSRAGRFAILAFLALAAGGLASPSARADTATIPIPPDDGSALFEMAPPADLAPILPTILAPASVELYTRIFEAQEEGRFAEADRLIGKLEDPLLLGHVLAQRYLHSGWRSSYKELKAWLDRYADHPGAERIYKLARARQPRGAPPPAAPASERPSPLPENAIASERRESSPAARKGADALRVQVRAHVRSGAPQAAAKLLEGADAKRLLGPLALDDARVLVAQGFYNLGRDEDVLAHAVPAAKRSLRHLPEAGWLAGLASWRLDRLDDAARHFEATAQAAGNSWLASAAAFWAARANLVGRNPERVAPWLERAARHPRTFYGLLAGHLLGRPMDFRWAEPGLERAEIARLARTPAGRRAVALVQVGEDARAERELRRLSSAADEKLARGILALAARADMPALALRLDRQLFPKGGGWMSAAYPLPSWEPENGFRIDPALIYALIHQESAFNPNAKSGAGASGLMQLMPRTASLVARDKAYHRGAKRKKLFSPEINLTLGQRYLETLIRDPGIAGDLFFIAAAWNGGPGNLSKWWRKADHRGDPLLFIESIPARETRIFVERVMANLWIYRHRLGQESPSLAQLAAGDWPTYIAQAGKLELATRGLARVAPEGALSYDAGFAGGRTTNVEN